MGAEQEQHGPEYPHRDSQTGSSRQEVTPAEILSWEPARSPQRRPDPPISSPTLLSRVLWDKELSLCAPARHTRQE